MTPTTSDFRALSIAKRIQLVEDIENSIATDTPESIGWRRMMPIWALPWDAVRTELFQRNH